MFKTASKQNDGSQRNCDSQEFGNDPFFQGKETQCWCEQQRPVDNYRCGFEGDSCSCAAGSSIVYARKFNPESQNVTMSFSDATQFLHTVTKAGNSPVIC
jgi:hypothetical protein